MTPEETARRCREARDLCDRSEPMSDADLAERQRLIAREYARREAAQSEQGALPL